MTGPAMAPINIERMLEEHLAEECERERRAIAALIVETDERRNRLNTLEAIGRAAKIPTEYVMAQDVPQIERAA